MQRVFLQSWAIAGAKKACDLTRYESPNALRMLAAVYAVAGRLGDAVDTATDALEIARASGDQSNLADQIEKALAAYKQLQADKRE